MSSFLDKLYHYTYKKQFSQGELLILALVESLLKKAEFTTHYELVKAVTILKSIYDNFNEKYALWVKKETGTDISTNLESLEHPNYLIAHCQSSAEMDDLLFELIEYLTSNRSPRQKQEVAYHLQCYKNHNHSIFTLKTPSLKNFFQSKALAF